MPSTRNISDSSLSRGVEMSETHPSTVNEQHLDSDGDDQLSDASSYEDPSDNDLTMWQGAALLTADCLGTGILALPEDVKVLGKVVGLGFLLLNLPINLCAGTLLSNSAGHLEQQHERLESHPKTTAHDDPEHVPSDIDIDQRDHVKRRMRNADVDGLVRVVRDRKSYSSIVPLETPKTVSGSFNADDNPTLQDDDDHHQHHDTATFDFIGMTQELFHHPRATNIVMSIYYTNIFLVLGDYILVMSHAVAALVGEDVLCLPQAGILASTLMFAVSQLRTMANLGRSATIISLSALFLVLMQCIFALRFAPPDPTSYILQEESQPQSNTVAVLRKFSALASIGFAVGSQKLFLNIRHEMKSRTEAPKSLGVSLSVFGSAYIGICLLAGPNPPSFLFDAIQPGWNRRMAGLLLWIHVAVSYAINSQAICSSMDRLFFHRVSVLNLSSYPRVRWMILTLIMAISSFIVANAIPFFKDLVALIGALTSVPLTLLFPALYHRKVLQVPLWIPTPATVLSYGLVLYSLAFLITGLVGSIGSIELDWSENGVSFSCQ